MTGARDAMSFDDSDSEFTGFNVTNLNQTLPADLENHSDISVSSVKTGDLSKSSDDERNVSGPGPASDSLTEPTWDADKAPITVSAFQEPVGPTLTLPGEKHELDFFELLFPATLYEWIATETNRYASQCQLKSGKVDKLWAGKPTSAMEICCFLGLHIYMSIVQLPSYKMYWSSDHLFGNFPVKAIMIRVRFEKILQYFHASDSAQNPGRGQPGHDKLHCLRPDIDVIQENAMLQYHPHRENATNEAMVAFRGRLGFRQYIPAKPHKYGIKVWVRADSHNGYVCEFSVYTGKDGNRVEVGLGESVVLQLCNNITGKHFHIYCDNYFTSVPLFKKLLEKGLYACGTIRPNRKCWPKDLCKKAFKKKPKGHTMTRQDGNLVASGWMDNKAVFLLSSNADPTIPSTVERKQKDGTMLEIGCPAALSQYNLHMNGVDMADQNRTQYSTCRKSIKCSGLCLTPVWRTVWCC